MHSDYPRLLHTTAREKSNYMQIERSVLQLIYMGQLLARISRRTITKHRDYNPQANDRDSRHLDAVRDWRFSEAVGIGLFRLVLRRAGGASARHRPTKVCDWVQVRWPRSRASGKHYEKTGLIFAIFQMSSNSSNFSIFSGP